MLSVSRDEITEGSLARAILLLAAPLVVQNMVQVVQQIVDTFWVGRLGEDAIAAVGLNFPVIALLFAVFLGINTGTQVLVSQRVGSDDLSGARRAVVHGLTLALTMGVTLALLVNAAALPGLSLIGPNRTVTELAAVYLAAFALGFPLVGMSDALEMGFVGWGHARAALYVNVVAVAVNLLLDPILIFGFGERSVLPALGLGGLSASLYGLTGFAGLGVRGAALATVAGYGAGFLLALALVVRGRDGYTLTRESFSLRLADYRELVSIGLPTTGQHAARTTARVLIIGVVSAVGGAAGLAAYTVCARIATVAYTPAGGINRAAQSVIGQNLGADRPDRAGRATWVGAAIAAVGLSLVGTIQWLVPGLVTATFVPDMTPAGVDLAVSGLRIYAVGYWAIGAAYAFEAGFNGARRTRVTMLASMLQYWAFRLPVAAVGAYYLDMGVRAVFWAVTLSNVVAAVGIGAYYYHTAANGMLDRAARTAAGD